MKKFLSVIREYPRTICYILVCAIVFWLLVIAVCYFWPQYFAGSEPISAQTLSNPTPEKIAVDRQAFLWRYLGFCGASFGFAFLFYIVFNLVCLSNYEAFCIYKHRWRFSHILCYASPLLAHWYKCFSFPGSGQKISNYVTVCVIILMFVYVPLAPVISKFRSRLRYSPTVNNVKKFVNVLDYTISAMTVIFDINIFQVLFRSGVRLLNSTSYLLSANTSAAYRVVTLPQFLMALVPLLPLLLLIMWCVCCLPKALGVGLASQTRSSFICFEKTGYKR